MGYKPIFREDVDAFLRLYRLYLESLAVVLERDINKLPTDVIERAFNSTDIHRKESELFIGFGYSQINLLANELEGSISMHSDGRLVSYLATVGHKVNEKKMGIREREK